MPDEDKNFRIFNFRFWKVMMSRENDLYKHNQPAKTCLL